MNMQAQVASILANNQLIDTQIRTEEDRDDLTEFALDSVIDATETPIRPVVSEMLV